MTETTKGQLLRALPSVNAVASSDVVQERAVGIDREILTRLAREAIDAVRQSIVDGERHVDPAQAAVDSLLRQLDKLNTPRLSEVINATGVIIHTNLGRAPVSHSASAAMALAASRYTPLELEIASGKRGGRMSEISRMLRLLAGAEESLVVNNNAAAVLLVLSELCAGKEVVLSRSQAVEIGGGFRIPSVLMQSGARLVEVGTTNRTYTRDYAEAITDETGALLTVHWSNFRIVGFTNQPPLTELAELARSRSLPLIEDLGSGSLLDTAPWGLSPEPTVIDSLRDGVDIVCFSGDKLLGGPQAGIISGRADLVKRISQHPLARAVRADKTALAGVAATLRHYINGEALDQIPVWRMVSASPKSLRARCERLRDALGSLASADVVEAQSAIGGGSLPGETLPSWALSISTDQADALARRLRAGRPAIMPHIEDNRLILDLRTVLPDQDDTLIEGLRRTLKEPNASE